MRCRRPRRSRRTRRNIRRAIARAYSTYGAAQALRKEKLLHDLDEANDCANDAYCGRVAASGFEDLRDLFFHLCFVVELHLHDLADFAGFGSIDGD